MKHATVALIVGLTLAAGMATAQDEPYKQRQAVMKVNGKAAKTMGDMLKGTTAFDAAAVNAVLLEMQAADADLPNLFPEGSADPESQAAPAIWENRADFDARVAKFIADIDAAVAANPQDEAGVQTVLAQLGENCKGCHENYRLKKE